MGHDISGYKNSAPDKEIAYLRRSAFSLFKNTIYEVLEADDCNCGCSGCGVDKTFTPSQLKLALSKLPKSEDLVPEREFLNNCINQDEDITIVFT